MAVADRCTVLRKGKYIGTVETKNTTMEELSAMMVGRSVNFHVEKSPCQPGEVVLNVEHMTVASKMHKNNAVKDVSFQVRRGEIVCVAGIDGNGQTELVYGLTGLEPLSGGKITMCGQDITNLSIRKKSLLGMSTSPRTATSTALCWTIRSRTTSCCSGISSRSSPQRRASCAATISASTLRA